MSFSTKKRKAAATTLNARSNAKIKGKVTLHKQMKIAPFGGLNLMHPDKPDAKTAKYEIPTRKQFEALHINGIQIRFPFKPYPSQIRLMDKITKSINCSQNALLESPTGTGKTLAILVASLAWLEHEKKEIEKRLKVINDSIDADTIVNETKGKIYDIDDDFQNPQRSKANKENSAKEERKKQDKNREKLPKIFVATRTQKQIEQMVKELREKTDYNPKMAILGSRDHYCINKTVLKKLGNKTEHCREVVSLNSCRYFNNVKSLAFHHSLSGVNQVHDIEDLVTLGEKVKGCPYYASRALAESAEIIFLPYNYLISSEIRKASDIDLSGSIVIIDEAHNIESSAMDSGSVEVSERQLADAFSNLNMAIDFNGPDTQHFVVLKMLVNSLGNWLADQKQNPSSVKTIDKGMTMYISPDTRYSGVDAVHMFNSFGVSAEK